jgi:hypothetical protein
VLLILERCRNLVRQNTRTRYVVMLVLLYRRECAGGFRTAKEGDGRFFAARSQASRVRC